MATSYEYHEFTDKLKVSPPQAAEGSLTPHRRHMSGTIMTWLVP